MILKNVLDVAVPLLVFVMMVAVGTELMAPDFRRVARQRPSMMGGVEPRCSPSWK